MCIDKNELLELLTYLVDNIFVVVGNRIAIQAMYRNSNGYRLCSTVGQPFLVLL